MASQDAVQFYESIRSRDAPLAAIEGQACHLIRTQTGYEPTNVGSFGLLLNLPDSDLDLSIGAAPKHIEPIRKALPESRWNFVATRETRPGTVRHVYRQRVEGVLVDLAIMAGEDLDLLRPGLARCRREMTDEQRAAHVWEKKRLKESGDSEAYAVFKLGPYVEYCPGFSWLPLP